MSSIQGPKLEVGRAEISPDAEFGPDVGIKCRRLKIGSGCRIGVLTSENFRSTAGVRVECDELDIGAGSVIERSVAVGGGRLRLGPGCRVGDGSTIRVKDELVLGASCQFGQENVVEGRRISVGRELWTGPQVRIGGGSCFEVQSELTIGYWCHLGMRTFVNTARRVLIGNEVGIGTDSAVFTHGAYQSALSGYPVVFAPVEIEDNCWIPGAIINPGVKVGRGAVVGVGSVVTKDIPAGCMAAGVPCRILKENIFPRQLTTEQRAKFMAGFLLSANEILADFTGVQSALDEKSLGIVLPGRGLIAADPDQLTVQSDDGGKTVFDLRRQTVSGQTNDLTEKLRDLLRRHGVRFFAEIDGSTYRDWRQE